MSAFTRHCRSGTAKCCERLVSHIGLHNALVAAVGSLHLLVAVE